MTKMMTFVFVGITFLILFLPYITYKTVEHSIAGGLTEGQIVNRLSSMALDVLFHGETA